MKYISTRGDAQPRSFSEILLAGLAPDGGLYLPVSYPQLDAATLERWRGMRYAEVACELLSMYIDDIPPADLRDLVERTYTVEAFGDERITPLQPLDEGVYLEQLSNGPTLAFKDMAMQLLGNLFEYELGRRGETLNVLGATSGDTGSAAEYALRGKRGINVFMLSPAGRMSPFQQAQMFSLLDPNIHNLVVDGVFDDCQDLVKAVSNDLAFKRRHRIGTVNSINWARLLAQVVYYVVGYLQAARRVGDPVSFAVPSGNFGNICAGHVARMMGLPIRRLVLATNENNVLEEFFRTGTYRVRSGAETHETSSPSMDISKASNFERFVYDVVGRDPARTRELFVAGVERERRFSFDEADRAEVERFGIVAGTSTHADRLATIRDTWERFGRVIDTHTADGLYVARRHVEPGVPMIVLETALAAKFSATVVEAIGIEPPRPPRLAGLEALPRRFEALPRDVEALKRLIAARDEPATADVGTR
ncbi:threonine synthase [Piscinibacter koreensis]|uniref:Threonine synthase n=1 Tax=Piscinibacter koreensis TaxID=2742824 RepID=A0A7Y6NN58_9BURK|nr:threonine synthase [Schlegelella koreensis]NUZ06237.1 threonine synthase [Schlegelella koreensis]